MTQQVVVISYRRFKTIGCPRRAQFSSTSRRKPETTQNVNWSSRSHTTAPVTVSTSCKEIWGDWRYSTVQYYLRHLDGGEPLALCTEGVLGNWSMGHQRRSGSLRKDKKYVAIPGNRTPDTVTMPITLSRLLNNFTCLTISVRYLS
jgi:hypothetical protein